MTLNDTLRTAVFALRGNWMRSTLTSLGVIIGIAAVIVMVSVGQGTQAEIDKIPASTMRSLTINTTNYNNFRVRIRSLPPSPPPRTQ